MVGFIMYIVAWILYLILFVVNIPFSIYKAKGLTSINNYFGKVATGVDALGNATFGELFNAFFITKGGYYFGKRKETISSAMGKNKEKGTLTWLGKALDRLLSFIDKDHCLKNIDRTV